MFKRSFKFALILFLIVVFISFCLNFVSATNCWQYTLNATGQCTSANGCTWKSDSWGSWCQELNCWSLYSQSQCTTTNIPGKNCTWQGGGTTYSCEEKSCFSFSGTNASACVNNSASLSCNWRGQCYSDGYSPPGTDCWSITNSSTCGNTIGCKWGQCEQKSCWNSITETTCNASKDWRGNNCTWGSYSSSSSWCECTWASGPGAEHPNGCNVMCSDSSSNQDACNANSSNGCLWRNGWCGEKGCWNYNTDITCVNAVGINCEWKYNSCSEKDCWTWDFTNSSACINNSLNLSCSWSGSYCNKKSCWNYGQTECTANSKCNWRAWTTSGWCEEINCWNWDSWKGGSQDACTGNSSLYGLGCVWTNMGGGGSCSKDYSSVSCSNKTTEKECMDTCYCWWQYNNWNNVSAGGNCNSPGSFGGTTTNTTMLKDWNPGCYVFDSNASDCGLITGCDNSTLGTCAVNSTHANLNEISTNGINCTMINNSQLCTNIPVLSSCCSWQNSSCITNKLTSSCWDQMKQKSENSCSDAKTKGKCDEISNSPWYMPCQWTNSTETCDFKASSVFGNSSQSLTFIDNKKTCEAAGGKWISENYCEGNISIPSGRCEYKFDDEKDCDKACFACEKYDSNNNAVNASNAESACLGSSLNYCEYKADINAPNGVGYCKAKQQFKKGIVSDCDLNCGDCTYLGTSTSNNTEKRPGYLCGESKANSVGGGCKWINDNSTAQGGYCINKGEKTCEDSCDRCKTQTDCSNLGRTSISNQTGSCKWQGDSNTGNCVANIAGDVEICWDAIDNNNDNLIDCADPGCYADSYCGFVSGDCFGWITKESCDAQNASCEWVVDKWGSWCDFKGSQCWKYTVNEGNCSSQSNCQWSNGTGSGWCEKDWSKAEACMGLNKTACDAASANDCNWTIDTWCAGSGNSSDWCAAGSGGWCDNTEFAPKNCWSYNSGSLACNAVSGCSWHADTYSTQMCEVNWSTNCWQYNLNATCTSGGCLWKNDSWGGWCTNVMDQCWSSSNQTSCEAIGNKCRWKNESWGGNCEPSCFSKLNSTSCLTVTGCSWKAESGWCEESASCWNYNQTGCTNATGLAAKCRWKNPGWCDPKGGGFSAGAIAGGGGVGGAMGGDCYKYDGNQSLCTNKSIINISCGWSINQNPSCEVNWNSNCWQYTSSDISLGCNSTNNCWWNPGSGGSGWCTNIMDQCWSNTSYQSWNNSAWLENCTSNIYCTNNSWGGCEPKCFGLNTTSCTNSTYLGKCKYTTGWCNPGSMNDMFDNMESGAPAPLGSDICPESIQSSVDLCGFGMKDMGDSYGLGANVRDFSNSSVCNKEELSSFVMGMFEAGGGSGFAGGGGSLKKIGSGNETIIYIVYLDTDGSTSGGCALKHNSSAVGYEFRFKYTSEWNASKAKAIESFNAYKCDNSDWKITDIKLSVWKKKMCSEIGGPMIAVEKADLEKFPTLYDSTKDIRVYVSTIGNTGNISSPTDNAGPGWATPGSVDFEINSAFAYGANMAKFEDILKKGFVEYEECFNGIDDNNDGNIDCNDWGCQYSSKCISLGLGVSAAGYADTSTPLVIGIKIEEYPDSGLVMYDTNKPTNGTLQFYGTDSQCLTLNASIYDVGILKNNTVREYKLWHSGEIYYDPNSLSYALINDTTYYYKLKVCDSKNKCAISKCSSFKTSSVAKCSYCNFVTRLKAPTGWNVSYDLDTNGSYEHVQGQVCGPNAGMKTNYTDGRKANVKLSKSDGSSYIEFLNVSLTKTALNDKVRTLSSSGDIIGDTSKIGMTSESRDKIINNLHPEICKIKIPSSGNCTTLYYCDESGNNCTDRTAAAGSAPIDSTNCTWNAPYCEFSTYKTNTAAGKTQPPSSGGGGGGGGSAAGGLVYVLNDEQFKNGYTQELSKGDRIKINVSGEYHFINLTSISSSSVQITITSTPQTAILSIEDTRRFDVTNDDYYDLSVKLDSISANVTKANLTVKSIHEKVTAETAAQEQEKQTAAEEQTQPETVSTEKNLTWVIVIIIVILILVGIGYWIKKRK